MENKKQALSVQAINALERGNKIEAIKITREDQGVGLKEAKDIVEAFVEKNPITKNHFRKKVSKDLGGVIIAILIVGAVASYFIAGK